MKNKFMLSALDEAEKALALGEIPVGCIITHNNEVISKAHNMREKGRNALYHAEILAIDEACKKINDWRLNECDIYVTLEPCMMCAGAILNARFRRIYFGAYACDESPSGGIKYIEEKIFHKEENIEIYGGICLAECAEILKRFFVDLRKKET